MSALRSRRVLQVAQIWGDTLLDVLHVPLWPARRVTIGSSIGHRSQVLGVDLGSGSTGCVARLPRAWEGHLELGERCISFERAVQEGLARIEGRVLLVPIGLDVRLTVEQDGVAWVAHLVEESRSSLPPEPADLVWWGIGAAVVGLVALFALLVALAPGPTRITTRQIVERYPVLLAQASVTREPPRMEPTPRPGSSLVCQVQEVSGSRVEPTANPVQLGSAPIVLGALPVEDVEPVVGRERAALRYCYARRLAKNPKLAGEIRVTFVVGSDGSVGSARIHSSTLRDPAVADCVVARFQRMRFPAREAGITVVRYPLVFAPD